MTVKQSQTAWSMRQGRQNTSVQQPMVTAGSAGRRGRQGEVRRWEGCACAGVALVAAAEAVWFVVGKLRFRHLNRPTPALPCTTRLPQLYEQFMQLADVFDLRDFLSGWFHGVPAEAIPRDNVEEFVIYGFYCQKPSELGKAERQSVSDFLDRVERRFGLSFSPGYNPSLRFMAHVWEPLRVAHKPLVVYFGAEAAARAAHALLWLMGFCRQHQKGFSCWVALPGSTAAAAAAAAGADAAEVEPAAEQPASPDTPWGLRSGRDSAAELAAAEPAVRGAGGQPEEEEVEEEVVSPTAARPRSPQLVQRHSAAEAVHHAAEHALDDIITVTSAVTAAVAARHPHADGVPASPRPLHAAAAAAGEVVPGASGCEAGMQSAAEAASSSGPAVPSLVRQRRGKADSALDYESSGAGGAGLAGDASTHPATGAGAEDAIPAAGTGPGTGPAAAAEGGSAGPTRSDVPIVFLHGVGFGVLPYLHLIRELMKACPESPVMMVEVPHVALRLCWEAVPVDEVAHAVAALLQRHGFRHACLVGHSYGSFCASRFCQLYPQAVHSLCVIDPVACLTCYPQLLSNFIYKQFRLPRSPADAVDMIRFLCSRDLTIAQAFCRLFHWSELQLWPADMPPRSLVVLSGQDDLVPSELVMAHLKVAGHPAKVLYYPDIGHGGLLMTPQYQAETIAHLRRMLLAGSALAGGARPAAAADKRTASKLTKGF